MCGAIPLSLRRKIRRWRERWLASDDRELSTIELGEYSGFQIAFRAKTADERVIAHGFEKDIFLAEIPDFCPQPSDNILDVGAHIGTFSLYTSRKVPLGRVIAVEASRESCNLLRINAQLNNCTNILVNHIALSDREGEIKLFHSAGNWGHSITSRLSNSFELVQACSLEALMNKLGIEEIALAKFNCEGAEFPVLLSTPCDILRKIQRMIVLYHSDLFLDKDVSHLEQHLTNSGFRIEYTKQTADRGWIIARGV